MFLTKVSFYITVINFSSTGHVSTPRTCASRLVYATAYFTALVVFIAFSAKLISVLTVQKSVMDIKDFQDLLNQGFKIGLLGGTNHQDYFEVLLFTIMIITFKYHVFAPMGRFQLELIYLDFPLSFHLTVGCFCPVGLSLL